MVNFMLDEFHLRGDRKRASERERYLRVSEVVQTKPRRSNGEEKVQKLKGTE